MTHLSFSQWLFISTAAASVSLNLYASSPCPTCNTDSDYYCVPANQPSFTAAPIVTPHQIHTPANTDPTIEPTIRPALNNELFLIPIQQRPNANTVPTPATATATANGSGIDSTFQWLSPGSPEMQSVTGSVSQVLCQLKHTSISDFTRVLIKAIKQFDTLLRSQGKFFPHPPSATNPSVSVSSSLAPTFAANAVTFALAWQEQNTEHDLETVIVHALEMLENQTCTNQLQGFEFFIDQQVHPIDLAQDIDFQDVLRHIFDQMNIFPSIELQFNDRTSVFIKLLPSQGASANEYLIIVGAVRLVTASQDDVIKLLSHIFSNTRRSNTPLTSAQRANNDVVKAMEKLKEVLLDYVWQREKAKHKSKL